MTPYILPNHVMYDHMTGADPFGYPTLCRPWDDQSDSMENAKRRLRAAFEFFKKLGVSITHTSACVLHTHTHTHTQVKYWSFHDR